MNRLWKLVTRRKALPRPEFEALREALLASPLVGRSTLAGPFQSSRGFAVTFRGDAGRQRVEDRFPSVKPWLEAVLGAPATRVMTPFWRRRRPLERVPNAWYLNVLLVSEGGAVAKHLDVTLREPAGVETCAPQMVSVLYLTVPPQVTGGALMLWDGKKPVAMVTPRENTVLHFRGDLSHAVQAFTGAPTGVRASLVIEQYHFDDEALARLPEFQLDSRAGFEAFMKVHEGRGVKFGPATPP